MVQKTSWEHQERVTDKTLVAHRQLWWTEWCSRSTLAVHWQWSCAGQEVQVTE